MPSSHPSDIVIIDETEPCPYLKGKTARMPLRMPPHKITRDEADGRLAKGNRRTGEFIYQTCCPDCNACEPIRIDCREYRFTRNQRRRLSKGNRKFRQTIGPLITDAQRIDLFNRHRIQRGLSDGDSNVDSDGYAWGFVRSCFESFEISYWDENELVCLGICDRGANCISAVYTFFDPSLNSESLGTFSILKQIEYCQTEQLQYLYLGYYIAASPHMRYKSRFVPNERLINGQWTRFDQ